jgi:hypothetical protein
VSDGLQQLVDDRNLRRFERRHVGPVEDEPAARAREQAKDHRMLAEEVSLKDSGCVAVELEHHGVERQHVLVGDVGRAGRGAALDRLHVGRQALGFGRSADAHQGRRYDSSVSAALQK